MTWSKHNLLNRVILASLFVASACTAAHAQIYNRTDLESAVENIKNYPHQVMVSAHRGLWGYSQETVHGATPDNAYPENSYPAFHAAGAAGIEAVEADVKLTRDHRIVLMHDFNLGRTTNYGLKFGSPAELFDPNNPNPALNPEVSDEPLSTIEHLHLLNPNRETISGEIVPELGEFLQRYLDGYPGPQSYLIFLDVKTDAALRECWRIVVANHAENFVIFKLNATIYSDPNSLVDALNTAEPGTASLARIDPIFTSNMVQVFLDDNTSVTEVATAYQVAAQDSKFRMPTVEVDKKYEVDPYLGSVFTYFGSKETLGVFQALPDFPATGEFFNNNGTCCYTLAQKLVGSDGPYGAETKDLRGEDSYLFSQNYKRFGLITTDTPEALIEKLAAAGLRVQTRNLYGYF